MPTSAAFMALALFGNYTPRARVRLPRGFARFHRGGVLIMARHVRPSTRLIVESKVKQKILKVVPRHTHP